MKSAHKLKIPVIVWVAASCGAGLHIAIAQTANSPEPQAAVTDCDRDAASDFDKMSPVAGIPFSKIDPKTAIPACLDAVAKNPDSARLNFQLGRAYDANKDFPNALKFFLKAARSNFALAEVNLGSLYFNGQGVEKDYGEAAKWDRLAADQGLAPAQAALGSLYVLGQGVARDYAEAERLLRLAASQGFAPAENALGDLYARGQGVERDASQAMKWYALAADHGYGPARTSLDALNAMAARDTQTPAGGAIATRPPTTSDPNAPRYVEAPAGEGYSPVKITVKQPDSRISNRVAATAIEIAPSSPDFSMTGFAVNKGNCRVYIQDPTALLIGGGAQAGENSSGRQAEVEKISLIPPPFNPPVAAKLGQYMTFYVDPSVCDIREVEVLVNGFEWKWTPG
ncbi:tetratricopeptide repeat protein [Methylocapsa sp. S129]|uniref:tetratricopeptide repeat protein n=1 Tax=Methylocapsa sp. S129 TaxID=1641869 RepID=UPI00131D20B2|nr:tetratricopeptide repeat protein [Methylocapsa sp. S129]